MFQKIYNKPKKELHTFPAFSSGGATRKTGEKCVRGSNRVAQKNLRG